MHKLINGKRVALTAQEIEVIVADWEANANSTAKVRYIFDRKAQYPPIEDQLDAILKYFNYLQINGQANLSTELSEVIDKWSSVKKMYPKPE